MGTAFRAAMADLLGRALRSGAPVRVYGEMVALLWEEGRVTAAMSLEGLWNDLATTHPFELLCGYPSALFLHPSSAHDLELLCAAHTAVTPASTQNLAGPVTTGRSRRRGTRTMR
jgi:hypothetical protein